MCKSSDLIIIRSVDNDNSGVFYVKIGIPVIDSYNEYLTHLIELCKEFDGTRINDPYMETSQFLGNKIYNFYAFRFMYFEAAENFYQTILLD